MIERKLKNNPFIKYIIPKEFILTEYDGSKRTVPNNIYMPKIKKMLGYYEGCRQSKEKAEKFILDLFSTNGLLYTKVKFVI